MRDSNIGAKPRTPFMARRRNDAGNVDDDDDDDDDDDVWRHAKYIPNELNAVTVFSRGFPRGSSGGRLNGLNIRHASI